MTRWAVQFGYDGRRYAGWARQPGLLTIEETIRRGVTRCGLAATPEAARIDVASRTDRGVSARANVLALSSEAPGPGLLRALNGIAADIFFLRAARVDERFRPRRALRRHYRYFERAEGRHLATWQRTARLFAGNVDVRSFGRGIPSDPPESRLVDRVSVHRADELFVIDVRAPRFVWGMVRKIISALREVDAGRLPPAELMAAIQGKRRLMLPLAEPESLILWEVGLGVRWKFRQERLSAAQQKYADRERAGALAMAEFYRPGWLPATPANRRGGSPRAE